MRVQAGRRVALVAALALMVGAGQWLRVSADVPQVAANTWASAGGFGAMPEGTASTPLADGRIVVAGGHNSDGTLVSQVGIYDPASQSWTDGGQLAMARTGHTVSALQDGRVLIAGGRTVNGPSIDVEIYNPNTGQSVHAGDLLVPRTNHAATTLGNGSVVLVAGGSNGSGVLDDIELFDTVTGQSQSLVPRMAVPREKFTATTLLDGHVLLAGGRNDTGNLAIAEIFVSGSHSIFETGSLRTARSGHSAVLLPNNNQVLIAGGTVTGAPSATAELYADWRDGFRTVTNPMSQARVGAVAGVLPQHNLGFVGGGGSTSGEYFGYATVKTDRADYWPGETVTITGSGWQPGETVTLKISEDADTHNDFTYTAVADAQGNIINTDFAPIEDEVFHHFGMRFYLTATGAASTALNTFTDGNATIEGTIVDSVTNAPITGATVTCATGCNNGTPSSLPTPANGEYLLFAEFQGNGLANLKLTVSAPGYVTQALVPITVTHKDELTNVNFSLVPNVRPTSTVVSCVANPIAVNASTTCTAIVSDTGTGTAIVPTGNVSFAVAPSGGSGGFDTTSCTLSGSPASCAVVYTPTARGTTGTHAITGSYSATSSHTDSSNAASPFTLTVNKAPQATLNLTTPANLVYGTPGTASVTGGSGGGVVTFSAGSSTGCSVDATSGAITVANASGTCAISAEKAADDNYLVATAGPNTVALEKADANVTVTGFNGTYDAQPHGATGTATGIGGVDLSSGLNFGTKFTNVPGGTANWTFDGGDNYADESGSVDIVIGKADAIVNVSGYTGTYDAQPHGATGTATGVGGASLPGLNLGGSFTDAPGGTANWSFSGGPNYFDESGSVQIVINKANATVTVNGYTGTYDGEEHGATGTATGVGGADLSGQLNLGAKFTNVPGGTANWTFNGGTNYYDQSGTAPIVITQADATVSVTGYSGTYDGAAHGASGTATGLGGVDLSAGFNFGQTFTDVPGGTANWTFDGGTNYKDQSGSVAIVITQADATVSVTGYSGTYDGAAHGASGTATGLGGVDLSSGFDFGQTFTDVPGGTATWTFDGGTNYKDQSGSVAIVITQADATVSVNGYTGVYDGNAHGATGTATGIGGGALPGLSLGDSFTDVPGGTANWSFEGGTNYKDQSGSVAIVITQADAAVSVTGYSGTYDGAAHGASGTATGLGGVDLSGGFNFGQTFTDVPGGTANWTFDGGTNYKDQSGSIAIVITQADATVSVSGYTGVYDGNAHGATGTATGLAGVDLSGGFNFGQTFTDVPGGTANWTFDGGTNYKDQSGSVAIVITQADATIVVAPYDVTYDTAAHTATGSATGVKGENLSSLLDLSATTHTNAGTYTNDPWTFAGNGNYKGDNGVVTNRIAKALPTVTITWANSVYNTNPNPASAVVNGVGGQLNLAPAAMLVYYAGAVASGTPLGGAPVNAGTYTVKASFVGNSNYTEKDAVKTITIDKANQTITFPVIGPKNYGDVFTISATASSGLPVTFSASGSCTVNGATVTIVSVENCNLTASQAGDNNYLPASDSQTVKATYTWSGILQPINQDGSSIFKLGSTIPVKFKLTGASASVTNLAAKISVIKYSNGPVGSEIEVFTNAAADAGNQFRYDPSGQLYIYNWGTKLSGSALSEGTWQIRVDLLDGNVNNTVLVTLKK